MTLLIVSADDASAQADAAHLSAGLQAAGLAVLGVVRCHMLVREVVRLAPQAVVVQAAGLDAALRAALALLASSAARPVLVVGAPQPPDDLAALLDARVMAWLPGAVHLPALRAALALAVPRFEREQALQQALDSALARLDERKWVDRAKGVLMRGRHLSEADAFALLRAASMQANLRVGEVSRAVIEAAQAADAVNRAGQIRMLSQRCVKALALRASIAADAGLGVGRQARPDDGLAETLLRLQANIDHLASLPCNGALAQPMADTSAAWVALKHVADPGAARRAAAGKGRAMTAKSRGATALNATALKATVPTAAALHDADGLAETLLLQADALTAALQAASGRRNLPIVNLCGRQRMLSQRLAKQALLSGLLPEPHAAAQAAEASLTARDFESTMAALEQAPLASDAIRAALAQARGQWQRLLAGRRRGPDAAAGRAVLAHESDGLLATFEALTSLYEHSMQVLMG